MTIGINLEFIDQTFPVAGEDNPSKGFRDNFESIILNFQRLNQELAILQNGTARTDTDSDFFNNTISNVNFLNSTQTAINLGNIDSDTAIDVSAAAFQLATVNDTANFTLVNWPTSYRYRAIQVALRSDGLSRLVKFQATGTQTIRFDEPWPLEIFIDSPDVYTIVEFFSFDGGTEIFASYKGAFQQGATQSFFTNGNLNLPGTAFIAGDVDLQGELIVNDDLFIKTSIGSTLVSVNSSTNVITLGLSAPVTGADDEIILGNDNIQRLEIPGLDMDITRTGGLKTPHGTTGQRPAGTIGTIRYNTTKNSFEGYDGNAWVGLGSITDQDQDTFIRTETPADNSGVTGDEDTFVFTTAGYQAATLSSAELTLGAATVLRVTSNEQLTTVGSGALSVNGGVSIDGDLLVTGDIINGSSTVENSAVVNASSAVETQTAELTFATDVDKFKVNNNIRIFGASNSQDPYTTAGLSLSAEAIGFAEATENNIVTFSYRIAQFDLTTGKVSPALTEVSVDIRVDDIVNFNNANNIQLTFSRKDANTGILIYRKAGSQVAHRLVAVLESLGIGSSTASLPWTDYYDYDLVGWSKKDFTNAYSESSGLVHFPLNPPEVSLYGWLDTRISDIDSTTSVVTVDDTFYSQGTSLVYKDDTQQVQNLIDLNDSLNINRLELKTRLYYISSLTIPPEFSLAGSGNTNLVKMPWTSSIESNFNIILKSQTQNINNVKAFSLTDITINGNAQNQYLTDDSRSLFNNYAIYTFGEGIRFEGVTLENVIGGGAYFYNEDVATFNIFFNRCIIKDGTLSYRYDYSPFVATEAANMNATQNNFSNFPKYVDVNSIKRSIVTSNIINNCGSGLYAFGIINSIINPNVIVGPAGEFLQGPDVLNSEFDSVNITLQPDVDYVSPAVVYQEGGELFNLDANQGSLSSAINELRKVNGIEVIATDYSETVGGTSYISFINSVNGQAGELQFRIQEALVDDLLSRANYENLYQNNSQTLGLIYRVFQTEYVPQSSITGLATDRGSNVYRIPVADAASFSTNDVIRLVDHNTTPTVATSDGVIVNINTITNRIDIQYDFTITSPGNSGSIALKNTFLVLKGKIN